MSGRARTPPVRPSAFWPRPRPGTFFGGVLLWIALSLAASVLLAPLVYPLVEGLAPGRFHFRRVTRRLAQLVALVLAVVGLRRLGVRRFAQVGLGWSSGHARQLARAAGASFALVALLLAIEFALGARRATAGLGGITVAGILLSSAAVALLEEGFCRGVLVFPFGRLSGLALAGAAALSSALFATAHFVRGGMRGSAADIAAAWQIWAAVPRAVVQYREAWIGLFVVSLALYLLAWLQGHAWGAIGAHFGAVVALQIAGRVGDVVPQVAAPFFVDGLLPGYGMAALLAVAILAGWMRMRRRAPARG